MLQILLLGDSQLVRYKNFLERSNTELKTCPKSITQSGVQTAELKRLIKIQQHLNPSLFQRPIVIIFVGTNDIVRRTPISKLQNQYTSLLRTVNKLLVPQRTILIALPCYPRFQRSATHPQAIDQFNKFLGTLSSQVTTVIKLRIPSLRLNSYFETHYRGTLRPDNLHLNNRAFELLSQQLLEIIKPEAQ